MLIMKSLFARSLLITSLIAATALGCAKEEAPTEVPPDLLPSGKADDFSDARSYEVLFNAPHCDVCENPDKDYLLANSKIMDRAIELIDGAQTSIDVAQFTFSRDKIEAALLRAHERGVDVRLAMNSQQEQGDNPSTRLRNAGVPVRFIKGKDVGDWAGLQHAKFMLVDDETTLMGSNNWSSTGVSINEENTIVVASSAEDPMIQAFDCYFEMMYEGALQAGPDCSTEDEVYFTPSTRAWVQLREHMRTAETSIDVLMHHLVFDDAVKELAKAAERGVRVRVLVNAADRAETEGSRWDQLRAAGGQIRYKQTNGDMYQLMHHKLGIFDSTVLFNGSGNWSGSAFFNNWEFYVRFTDPVVVNPFNDLFGRLWGWSLTADSLDAGRTAREQDIEQRTIYFGNLHAHMETADGDQLLDDGNMQRLDGEELVDVSSEANGAPARYAFEYARDAGGLDFMALSPHVVDDRPDDPPDIASMSRDGYANLLDTARDVTDESGGTFLALPAFEWSTNSTGGHVNVFGSEEIAKVERGDFRTLYEGFLPVRREAGDPAYLMLNHPRTFRHYDALNGSWDQIFGVNLSEIPRAGERDDKFNDFGLDDFAPVSDVLGSWIAGEAMPDEAIVRETVQNIAEITRDHHRLMEVTISRGTSIRGDEPQNPSLTVDDETGEVERFTKIHSDFDYYLLNDWRLAPAASHDNHYANWGTGHTSRTAVLATDLSEAALYEAIGERAVYASEDENLELRLYANDLVRAGGTVVTLDGTVTLQLHLKDPDYSGSYDVKVWGGTVGGESVEIVDELAVANDNWTDITVEIAELGVHFFYVEVLETEPNRMAWSAPIWVDRR